MVFVVLLMIVIGGMLIVVLVVVVDLFFCMLGVVYVQSVIEVCEFVVNVQGGVEGDGGSFSFINFGVDYFNNVFGVLFSGCYVYMVMNVVGMKIFVKYDCVIDVMLCMMFLLNFFVLCGVVYFVMGVYYFVSGMMSGVINFYVWNENVMLQIYVQVGVFCLMIGSSVFGVNGDMVFSVLGQFVLVVDNIIYFVDFFIVFELSMVMIDVKQVYDMGVGVQGNGIVFGNLGYIFVFVFGGGNCIIEVDFLCGQMVNMIFLGNFVFIDMVSCMFLNMLMLKKDFLEGCYVVIDQFVLCVQLLFGYQVVQIDVIMCGECLGVQFDYVGLVFMNQGDIFWFFEMVIGMSDFICYDELFFCVQVNLDGLIILVIVIVDGQVIQFFGLFGIDVICMFMNVWFVLDFVLCKMLDFVNGIVVQVGQCFMYMVQVENIGNMCFDFVMVFDDLFGVCVFVEYQGDVVMVIDGDLVLFGVVIVMGDDFVWIGVFEFGQVFMIMYFVVVDVDVEGECIVNCVMVLGILFGFDLIVLLVVMIEYFVVGFEVVKIFVFVVGSVVEFGQIIEYMVIGCNIGVIVLNLVFVIDDFFGVFVYVVYDDDIFMMIDGIIFIMGGVIVNGDDFVWIGIFQFGQIVIIMYFVMVGDDVLGEILCNSVFGFGMLIILNLGDLIGLQVLGELIVLLMVIIEYFVIGFGFMILKLVDFVFGIVVFVGDMIIYMIIGINMGDIDFDLVEIVDDLFGVFDFVVYNDDVMVDCGMVWVFGSMLIWIGGIFCGEFVIICYMVMVDVGIEKVLLYNVVIGMVILQILVDLFDFFGVKMLGMLIVLLVVEMEYFVVDMGFEIMKLVDLVFGIVVCVDDILIYMVLGFNIGNIVFDLVMIVDDLLVVFVNVEYGGDVEVFIGFVVFFGVMLIWIGILVLGDCVDIIYIVMVYEDVIGVLLCNMVMGEVMLFILVDLIDLDSLIMFGILVMLLFVMMEYFVVIFGFIVIKMVDFIMGICVDFGSVIVYIVIGCNMGDIVFDLVVIGDDLCVVLVYVFYNDDVFVICGDVWVVDGFFLWSGVLQFGQDVVIIYLVIVDVIVGGEIIVNMVIGEVILLIFVDLSDFESFMILGMLIMLLLLSMEYFVNEFGFMFVKMVDLVVGIVVDVGDVFMYMLMVVNMGQMVFDLVMIIDDLFGVLLFVIFNVDVVVSIVGVFVGVVILDGVELLWMGVFVVGQIVIVIYFVIVIVEGVGIVIENVVIVMVMLFGGLIIMLLFGIIINFVNELGFFVLKSVDLVVGMVVDFGSVFIYMVIGVNMGEMVFDFVIIVDDFFGVLVYVDYNDDVIVMIGGMVMIVLMVVEDCLLWMGVLQVGEIVMIMYFVIVGVDVGGIVFENLVFGLVILLGGVFLIEMLFVMMEYFVNEFGFELCKFVDFVFGI